MRWEGEEASVEVGPGGGKVEGKVRRTIRCDMVWLYIRHIPLSFG